MLDVHELLRYGRSSGHGLMKRVLLLAWLGAIAMILALGIASSRLGESGMATFLVEPLRVALWGIFVATTLYWTVVVVRWLMRALFWRVGRRLALSYLFVGALPFVIFAILLVVMGYLMGGALSKAAVRAERQATLVTMDRWNLEYSLAESVPEGENLEVYDSASGASFNGRPLPEWLNERSFSGLAARDDRAVFVSSRVYVLNGKPRTIALVRPADETWAASVLDRGGMEILNFTTWKSAGAEADTEHASASADVVEPGTGDAITFRVGDEEAAIRRTGKNDEVFWSFFTRNFRWGTIIWFDTSGSLVEWESGQTNEEKKLTTVVANPVANIRDTYFGGQEYAEMLINATMGVGGLMLFVYGLAALFAGVMIFSVSRAVNRIERGTKAVEHGDFSYRIRMKPRNQLGEVATSFDRMTESIASLLHRVAEQERLQSEIDIAASIQRNLLPSEGPSVRGVSFAAHFEPSAAIGGDYYDVFSLDRSRLAVAIGDVSGHGLSTGLVMAMVKAAMTTLVEEGTSEESLFRRLNDLVYQSTDKRAFMTLGFTIFDLERKTIRHTNAGHIYPYVLRKGEPLLAIEGPSLPLGVRPDVEPHTTEIDLREGDTVVYLSDGIVEAQNEDRDPFGFVAIEALLATMAGSTPAEIQTTILDTVDRHAGDRSPDDDRTVMILRFDELEGLHSRAEIMELEQRAAEGS
jgi:serine phosphatase RsbU (regulator of sigma subunit)